MKENNALTLTCHVTDISYTLFQWKNTGDGNSYDIYRRSNDACFRFSAIIDFTLNQFSCSGNNISWTIRNVTRQQHGDELYCMTNDLAASESSKTRVFVIGNNFDTTKQV